MCPEGYHVIPTQQAQRALLTTDLNAQVWQPRPSTPRYRGQDPPVSFLPVSLYGRLFAAGYDTLTAGPEKAGLRRHREALLGRASGRVIEIGGGTGANLPLYGTGVSE